MKLITLNIWGGRVHKPFLEFLEKHKEIDIFCFQEVYHQAQGPVVSDEGDVFNIFSDIKEVLVGHNGYFRPSIEGYGLAIFVKKNIQITKEGDVSIYEVQNYDGGANHSRNLHYVELQKDDARITVITVHGLWNGKGKTDTEDRIQQSKNIKAYMDSVAGKKILCGDFNLRPDTESLKIIETGMRNLVMEYAVTSTRTSLYTKPEKFADYIFVSQDVNVIDFKVLSHEVSDHAPLYLEFDL